jgi:hypothetical protein
MEKTTRITKSEVKILAVILPPVKFIPTSVSIVILHAKSK